MAFQTFEERIRSKVPAHLFDAVQPFMAAASSASYHNADDSGKEWHLAKPYQAECQRIFDEADEELRAALRSIKGEYMISIREPQ